MKVEKKDEKSGKKKEKGKIQDIKYMDGDELASDVDEGENKSEKINDDNESGGKKRKKGV